MGETRFVMGCISQLQDGRYFLEDLSDALPIELSEAQTTSGFFTGESSYNSVVPQIAVQVREATRHVVGKFDASSSTSWAVSDFG